MQTVRYQLTAGDLTDARIYVHRNLPISRVLSVVIPAATFACALYVAYLAWQGYWCCVRDWAPLLALGVFLTVWMQVGNRWLVPGLARKHLARSKGLQDEVTASWDADLIKFESRHGDARWPWSDLFKWQESPGGLLLWPSDGIYHYLPKRALTDDQAAEIRHALSGALGKPGKRRL